MSSKIKPLFYEIQDLGKYLKSSKKKYVWRFELENKEHLIELEHSLLSGKRKIICDSRILYEGTQVMGAAFQYPFSLDNFSLNIIQQGEIFELRINNQVFTHLWQQEKTKSEFIYDDDQKNNNEKEQNKLPKWDNFDSFGQQNNDNNNKSSPTEKKMRFSVNLNIGKKDVQPVKQNEKFKMTESVKMDTFNNNDNNFNSFNNFGNQPKNQNVNFGAFDFNSFGQPEKSQDKKELTQQMVNFGADFQNLGKFNPKPKEQKIEKTIDLLDLMESSPAKIEIIKQTSQTESLKNNGADNLLNLVFDSNPNNNIMQSSNILNDKAILNELELKKKEEIFKKTNLLDQAFGPGPVNPPLNYMNQPNSFNPPANYMYYSQPASNVNFNNMGGFIPMNNQQIPPLYGINPQNQNINPNLFNVNKQNQGINKAQTPFDQF